MISRKRSPEIFSDEYRYLRPASAQDCTGLIPGGPAGEQELEYYEELYPFLPKIPENSKYRTNNAENQKRNPHLSKKNP